MKKKLISFMLAHCAMLCLCGAFIIPTYAEEYDTDGMEAPPEEEIVEEIIEEMPPEIFVLPLEEEIAEPVQSESETTAGLGVIETPYGAGSVLEDVSNNEVNRQFITVQTKGGNVFYIIIDYDRNGQNVYFLNAVDDFDLLSFSENFPDGVWEAYEELKEEAAANAIIAEIENADDSIGVETSAKPSKNADPDDSAPANNTQIIIIAVIGVAFAGGFVYFKFIKGKKKAVKSPSFDDEEEDEDEDEDEIQDEEDNE